MEKFIKELEPDDVMSRAINKITNKTPSKFIMLPGYKATIRRISNIVSNLDVAIFEKTLCEEKSIDIARQQKSPEGPSKNPFNTSPGNATMLSPNVDYKEKTVSSLMEIIKIASPQIDVLALNVIEESRDATTIKFNVECCYCQAGKFISVSTYISNGYPRVVVSNFSRHVIRKHEEPGKRLTAAMVSF